LHYIFDIEDIVQKPTLKQLLLELIDKKKVDPWNVDILSISDAFLKKVRELEKLDFGIQANVILAAAILLRYKSDYLQYLQYQTTVSDFVSDELPLVPLVAEDLSLSLASRIPPKRQITMEELISEMEKIIKYENVERAVPKVRGGIEEYINLALTQEDIEKRMDSLLHKIYQNSDDTGWSLFSRLVDRKNNLEVIYSLLSVLHLTQREVIDLRQDELFGEIFIHVPNKKGKIKEN